MDTPRDTDVEKSSTGTLTWIGMGVLLLVLYILSPGPLRLLIERGYISRPITFIFLPLEWAYHNNASIRALYDAYFSLFGL